MQIMPRTADHLGLSRTEIYDPERNIAAAAKYIYELSKHFSDVSNPIERSYYVLASYNGGYFHIRDAMALARKYGRNPYSWSDVREFVLRLSTPPYYNDPVVKYGYMRGHETVDYVSRIVDRWAHILQEGDLRGIVSKASVEVLIIWRRRAPSIVTVLRFNSQSFPSLGYAMGTITSKDVFPISVIHISLHGNLIEITLLFDSNHTVK